MSTSQLCSRVPEVRIKNLAHERTVECLTVHRVFYNYEKLSRI
jgi:hypothetical protein